MRSPSIKSAAGSTGTAALPSTSLAARISVKRGGASGMRARRRRAFDLGRLPARLLLAACRDVVRGLQVARHGKRMGEGALALRALQPLDAAARLGHRASTTDRAGDRHDAVSGAGERAAQLLDETAFRASQLMSLGSQTVLLSKQTVETFEQRVEHVRYLVCGIVKPYQCTHERGGSATLSCGPRGPGRRGPASPTVRTSY